MFVEHERWCVCHSGSNLDVYSHLYIWMQLQTGDGSVIFII